MNAPITQLTAEVNVNTTVEKIWKLWTTPADIIQWNNPSDDWHAPYAESELKEGGSFLFRMETKDGSIGFDHKGKYDKIVPNDNIEYTQSDGRKSTIKFIPHGNSTRIIETFDAESATPVDMQRDFCQGVLNNFKQYAESKSVELGR